MKDADRKPWKPNIRFSRYALMIGMPDKSEHTVKELMIFTTKAADVANKAITKMMESNKWAC